MSYDKTKYIGEWEDVYNGGEYYSNPLLPDEKGIFYQTYTNGGYWAIPSANSHHFPRIYEVSGPGFNILESVKGLECRYGDNGIDAVRLLYVSDTIKKNNIEKEKEKDKFCDINIKYCIEKLNDLKENVDQRISITKVLKRKTDYLNMYYEDIRERDKIFKLRIQRLLLECDCSNKNEDPHIPLKKLMKEWDSYREKEEVIEEEILELYMDSHSEDYLEDYKNTREELAKEDYAEVNKNENHDPKIKLRYFSWLSKEEDDDETIKIVHQRMIKGLF